MFAAARHLFLTAAFFTALPALAGTTPTCPPQPIRVGYFEFGIMYNAERGDRSGNGVDSDLVAELAKRSGCRFEGVAMTRARIWSEYQAGRLDLTLAAVKTPEREAMAWMFPYVQVKSVMLLSPHLPAEARTQQGFAAQASARFGIVHGFRHAPRYEPIVEQMRQAGRLQEATDEASLIRLLKAGTIMAMVSNTAVYPRYVGAREIPGEVLVADWGAEDPLLVAYTMFSKQTFSEAESRKWRELLSAIRRDGTLQAIAERYVDRETARKLVHPGN